MNWIKRYIHQEYEDYRTNILDAKLGVDKKNREKILSYGSEYFTKILDEQWESQVIKNMVVNLQNFLRDFVTCPETGDNRFIMQPAFYNRNIVEDGSKKKRVLLPRTYGWQDNLQISIDMLFNMQNFITYDEFKTMFYRITGGKIPAESSYLKFRHDIMTNFGPVNKGKKYPPPIKNKNLEEWVFQSPIELFKKTKKGSRNCRKKFHQKKVTLQKNS